MFMKGGGLYVMCSLTLQQPVIFRIRLRAVLTLHIISCHMLSVQGLQHPHFVLNSLFLYVRYGT